ncbi:head-tail connector protein [Niameybacter massiliensis]|uniref:Head-tail connector protein n=1 Tax=Holtiella tumoricola TaxID=3018743 RepID=A0AA42DN67_9FIRM|nr:head-tail connector protein [Holtiella tumoricola]MDA3732114.1 head-tail connector protein [Holtiella tumoricola]
MVTLEQAKNYTKVDGDDDDNLILQLIEISQIYIDGLVGEGYKVEQNYVRLADLLQLLIISDMYDNRSLVVNSKDMNKIAHGILDKLSNYTVTT